MSFQQRNDTLLFVTSPAGAVSATVDCTQLDSLCVQATYTAISQSAAVFASSTDIDAATETFTKVAHGLLTGTVGQFTTSNTLPTGLATSTNYFVIAVTADTLRFATSLANALAGTYLSISTTGTGNQTFTPAALSGVLKVQMSNEPVATSTTSWTDVPGSTVTISGTGSTYWSSKVTYIASSVTSPQIDVSAKWMRLLYTPASGAVTLTAVCNASSLTRS